MPLLHGFECWVTSNRRLSKTLDTITDGTSFICPMQLKCHGLAFEYIHLDRLWNFDEYNLILLPSCRARMAIVGGILKVLG